MKLKKMLANPIGHQVEEDPKYPEPKPGDKVIITNWMYFPKKEIMDLIKLDHLTVKEVNPVVLSRVNEEGYFWSYEIYTEESPGINVLGWHYKIVKSL